MKTAIAFFMSMFLFVGVANAQTYELYRLPAGTRLTTETDTYQGFNLGEYRALLHMDLDLWYYEQLIPLLEQVQDQLFDIVDTQQMQLRARAEQVNILEGERTRLTNAYLEENRLRHRAENRPRIGSVVAWVSAIVGFTAAIVASAIAISE